MNYSYTIYQCPIERERLYSRFLLGGVIMPKLTQTPGAMLKNLIAKNGISVGALAKEIHTSDALIYLITQGKSRISVPVAFRLARYFKTTPEYWLAAQLKHDIAKAMADKGLQKSLKTIGSVSKAKK
jgi:addiction module HigA family antidote